VKILIVSDIHANRIALEAVLADAGPVDEIWSLGDVVGYGPEPGKCVDRLIELEVAVSLSGNHDLAAIGRLDMAQFNFAAQTATAWTAAQLSQGLREYLESLPSLGQARGITVAHGSPRAPVWEYIADAFTAGLNFDVMSTDACLVGHTHSAAVSERTDDHSAATHSRWLPDHAITLTNRRLILNPGSVGQPRDGDPRASYALFDTAAATVTLQRTPYDIESVQAHMRRIGLPPQLADRLAGGR
jgi:diadenosine tetraphosphatase ApaH/serine/threonine PP2A family protein phosphatase